MERNELLGRLAARLSEDNPWWDNPGARPPEAGLARRAACQRLIEHVLDEERRAIVVEGPRQVGKTTLLLQVASQLLDAGYPPTAIVYCDFSLPGADGASLGDLDAALPPSSVPRVYLLDEIAQSPEWHRWLKGLVDRRAGKWLATDSSATFLRLGTQESGMGRWDVLRIEGLSFREFVALQPGVDPDAVELALERQPNLVERYLALGGYPEHAQSDDFSLARRRVRHDVVERALGLDLFQRVGDTKRLRALFAYLVEDSGSILNAAKRARDLEVDRRTVQDWIAVLVDAALLADLPRETRGAAARLRANDKPRIYAADHGVLAALSPSADPDFRSKIVECVVFTHLRLLAREHGGKLSYFRPREDIEIDFLLDLPSKRVAIEVTASSRVAPEKFGRARTASASAGATSLCLVHGGIAQSSAEGVKLFSLRDFLLQPSAILPEEDG